MRADLERLIDEGKLAGLSHDAAVDQALELFGCPRAVTSNRSTYSPNCSRVA